MGRFIRNLYIGKEVKYFEKKYKVIDLYSHIAYLESLDSTSEPTDSITDKINNGDAICVCTGDLVIAGLEQSMWDYIPEYGRRK